MRLAGAWALLPELAVQERDTERERAALDRLACWAGGFTSEVSLKPSQTLLLEVAGSLRLFGGAVALFERVMAGCREQGFAPQAALAPTPLAAEWLAKGGDDAPCLDPADLPRHLGALPLQALDLAAPDRSRLAGFGVRVLGDVLRLPRAGLAHRLGTGFAADLARALGELPDPRQRFVFPEKFALRLELQGRVDNAPALGFAGRRSLAALCGWLAARNCGIAACTFEFEHERGARKQPATLLRLRFAGLTRDTERMVRVLVERLQALQLSAPVDAFTLRAEQPKPLAGHDASLFSGVQGKPGEAHSIAVLVERLQARLGSRRVFGLATVAEHRPENASQAVAPKLLPTRTPSPASATGPRPFWLLPQPQALRETAGRPQRNGPLQLLAGPERIESGWWDAAETDALGDVRRDYFIALSPHAEWLWIFRSADGWFLHGVFA